MINVGYQQAMYEAGQIGAGQTVDELERRIAEAEATLEKLSEELPFLHLALQMKRGEDPTYWVLNQCEARILTRYDK